MDVGRGAPGLVGGFVQACREAGATAPVVDVEGAAMDLLHRWGDPARGYHDVEHLAEVLGRLRELSAEAADVVLAAWFHDAVYEREPGRDEEASAALAEQELTALGVPAAVVGRVGALVRTTAGHQPDAGDAAAQALCDADLAVLAADEERYARYAAGVRREYSQLDDAAFARGRAAVLRSLTERPSIFATAQGRARWEHAARRNVASELARLESS